MKKNVASQLIGVQMVTATDGSAFTGTATVVITIDGGTQSASGGTGPTHEGNGFHTYLPTQAETNGDHIGFTFTGTGAVPVTIQVWPTFPQTADAPTAVATRTEIDSNSTQLTAIVADTNELQVDDVPGLIATLDAVVDTVKAETALIVADTSELQTDNVPGLIATLDAVVDTVKAETALIVADTNELQVDNVPGLISTLDAVVDTVKVDTAAILIDTADIQPNYATATNLATVDTVVDGIQTDLSNGTDGLGALATLINGLDDVTTAEVLTQVNTALNASISELGVAAPTATPSVRTALMLMYMALRNLRDTTASADIITNNAGTTICSATVSDDAVTFRKTEYS